ncbi:hypothetical protein EVAR_102764_1 [Eumeta japonica]|uniref:Uncharacterized protein n=1 Tax=Eumeta variegata TaxID=151549 RepID=A0A4C1TKW3_EUMVA|nr:hypothetical protein EVAR_102764_1 [Eumeta japonica]
MHKGRPFKGRDRIYWNTFFSDGLYHSSINVCIYIGTRTALPLQTSSLNSCIRTECKRANGHRSALRLQTSTSTARAGELALSTTTFGGLDRGRKHGGEVCAVGRKQLAGESSLSDFDNESSVQCRGLRS